MIFEVCRNTGGKWELEVMEEEGLTKNIQLVAFVQHN